MTKTGEGDRGDGRITIIAVQLGEVFDCGLPELLAGEPDIELLGCGLEPCDLEETIIREVPSVAILGDASSTSWPLARLLRIAHPSIALVVLADGLSEQDGWRLLALGATVCLPLDVARADLLTAIRVGATGMQIVLPARARAPVHDQTFAALTPREQEVFGLVQAGRLNAEIAAALHISPETVRTHVQKMLRKTGMSGRRQLLAGGYGEPPR